jgi:hypothetical protein
MKIELQDGITINVNKFGLVYFYQDNDIVGPFDKIALNNLTGVLGKLIQTTGGSIDIYWQKGTLKLINRLAQATDFTLRVERYAEETGNKFLLDKARSTLSRIKGEHT